MTKEQWKEELRNSNQVDTRYTPDQERTIREAISELRREGTFFIPSDSHTYQRVTEETPMEMVEKFVGTQLKHLATQYFNTVKPLKNYVADEKLRSMMTQLLFLEQIR